MTVRCSFDPKQTNGQVPQREEDLEGQGLVPPTTHLMDDVDAILQLLPLQEGMKVLQQVHQVLLSVPVRDEDGNALQSLTLLRVILASVHLGVFCLHFFQSEIGLENELVLASCNTSRMQ